MINSFFPFSLCLSLFISLFTVLFGLSAFTSATRPPALLSGGEGPNSFDFSDHILNEKRTSFSFEASPDYQGSYASLNDIQFRYCAQNNNGYHINDHYMAELSKKQTFPLCYRLSNLSQWPGLARVFISSGSMGEEGKINCDNKSLLLGELPSGISVSGSQHIVTLAPGESIEINTDLGFKNSDTDDFFACGIMELYRPPHNQRDVRYRGAFKVNQQKGRPLGVKLQEKTVLSGSLSPQKNLSVIGKNLLGDDSVFHLGKKEQDYTLYTAYQNTGNIALEVTQRSSIWSLLSFPQKRIVLNKFTIYPGSSYYQKSDLGKISWYNQSLHKIGVSIDVKPLGGIQDEIFGDTTTETIYSGQEPYTKYILIFPWIFYLCALLCFVVYYVSTGISSTKKST